MIIEIDGREYEVTQNYLIGKEIAGTYAGFKLECKINGYKTEIYKTDTSYFNENKTKLIGTLILNYETNQITLYKFVNDEEHKFIKGQSYGICNEIIKHLRTSDRIFISNGKENYTISVAKALKVGSYINFKEYELQLMIPISEFKCNEIKGKKKK